MQITSVMCLKRNLEYLRQNTENHQNRNMDRYESEKKQKEKARKKEYNSKYDAEYFSLDGYTVTAYDSSFCHDHCYNNSYGITDL